MRRKASTGPDSILAMKPNHPPTCRFLADYHARKGNQGLANYFRSLLP